MKPPKLLFVVTEDWYFVSHRLSLAMAAKREGYEVVVATRIANDHDKISGAGMVLRPLNFDRGGLNPFRDLRTLVELMRLYRAERPDIVHHVALKPVLLGSIAARFSNVKGIVNSLGGLGYLFSSKTTGARVIKSIIKPFLRLAMSRGNSLTIVQNIDDRDRLVGGKITPPDHIRLIQGAGVDMAKYRATVAQSSDPLVILPARLLRDKGVNEFVAAAVHLRKSGVRARFALIGKPDPDNPASVPQSDIDRWAREGYVEIWGWQEDMPSIFSQAQIVCLPSYHEGFPKSLLEAAASSCAIIASDIPGCRALITEGETGWLVKPGDVSSLVDALAEAIKEPQLRERFGRQAFERTEKIFSSTIIAQQTMAVYRELKSPR